MSCLWLSWVTGGVVVLAEWPREAALPSVTSSVHASKTNEVSNFAKDLLLIGDWVDKTKGIARQIPFFLRLGLMEQKGIENPFS